MKGRWRRILIAAALLGSATSIGAAEAPDLPGSSTEAAIAAVPGVAASPDYVIGPGDALNVFVWRNPELTVNVPVRPDGKISTPLVEDMVAVGKTPSQLARDIEKVLSAYVRSPQVNVIVNIPVGALSQVKGVGQLHAPQGVPFREGMRVLDLVLATGGLTEFAAGNRAKIVRTLTNGTHIELHVKLSDLLNKGDMRQNPLLMAGDVLIVPESMF